MATLASLLSFPAAAPSAFTVLKLSLSNDDDGASPPPRKQARTSSIAGSRLVSVGGPRKIPVRNASLPYDANPPSSAPADLTLLRRALASLLSPSLSSSPPLPSYHALYAAAERTILLAHDGATLYTTLKMELERGVSGIAQDLGKTSAEGVAWVEALVKRWEGFQRSVGLIRSFLLHLDQTYVLHQASDKPSILELAHSIFRDKVLTPPPLIAKLDAGIAAFLASERADPTGPHPYRPLLTRLASLLTILTSYTPLLLTPYLAHTRTHYTSLPQPASTPEAAIAFLSLADAKISEEISRANAVLTNGVIEVRHAVEEALLGGGKMEVLSAKALPPLLAARSLPALHLLHSLSTALHTLPALRTQFTSALSALVASIIAPQPPSAEKDEEMVPSLLALRSFAEGLAGDWDSRGGGVGGESGREWRNCLLDAFERGFAGRSKKPAEMIAKYIDLAMRRGQRTASDDEFQRALDDALGLYRFTKDKDVFREFYIRALAKRLLLQKSASDDFELSVLKRLKDNDKYFEKGDGMFSDLQLSRDMTSEWHALRALHGTDERLSVMVLQHSNWPTYNASRVILPKDLEPSLTSFLTFYKSKHAQRKLDWAHSLGTATLTARFDGGVKELSVSLFQAVVLLLFEQGGTMAFKDIAEATGIEDTELRRTLQSLACGRKRVLTKIPVGRDVNDTDQFAYNAKFTDKNRRLHINSIQQTETAEEAEQIATHIEEDRTHALDAAIVRIMKARKRLRHQELQQEVIVAVRAHFVPQPPAIKRQIDSLIEREYLCRAEGERMMYEYVA